MKQTTKKYILLDLISTFMFTLQRLFTKTSKLTTHIRDTRCDCAKELVIARYACLRLPKSKLMCLLPQYGHTRFNSTKYSLNIPHWVTNVKISQKDIYKSLVRHRHLYIISNIANTIILYTTLLFISCSGLFYLSPVWSLHVLLMRDVTSALLPVYGIHQFMCRQSGSLRF